MSILNRRQVVGGTIGLAAALSAGILPSRAASSLVVPSYGGRWGKFWSQQIIPGLTSATGIEPTHDVGLGKNFVANIRAGGGASPYSIFMGNENIATMLRQEGFFEPFNAAKLPNVANVYDNFKNPGLNGVRGIISPIGIGYRTDLVKTPPTSWDDLWSNPEFKGKIGLYQIGNTAAVLFLLLTARLYGGSEENIDVAFEKIKQLLPFEQVSWSGAAAASLVKGDSIVAPVDWGEVIALKKKGCAGRDGYAKGRCHRIRTILQSGQNRTRKRRCPQISELYSGSKGAGGVFRYTLYFALQHADCASCGTAA